MKLIHYWFLMFFVWISSLSFAEAAIKKVERDSLECLEISGIITQAGKPQLDATIKLWLENDEIANLSVKKQYKFMFKLKKQSHYTIEVSKPGYITRLISVSTLLPQEVALDNIFRFFFELELITESKNIDPYYSDFPTAFISYDPKIDAFQNDAKYSAKIKRALLKH